MKIYILFVVFLLLVSFTASSQIEDRYEIKHLTNANTKYSDFGVSYFGDDQVVFASSRKVRSLRNSTWRDNSQPYLNLYRGNIAENGEILDSELFSSEINTRYHEADAVFTSTLKTVYFTRNNYFGRKYKKDNNGMNHLKLFRAHIDEDGKWGDIEDMTFNNNLYSVGHPALSSDGKILYFVSDMPGGQGKTDIYYVHLSEDGTYGAPINAGPIVNTMNREMFPFLSKSGILYYSSDGRSGLGGLDVFKSIVSENGTVYTKPENLGSPINSEMDDFSFTINEKTLTGYFSSNRENGKGDDDIYCFKEIPTPVICKQYANGIIRDKGTDVLLPGAIVTLYKDGIEIEKVTTGNNARFAFTVECESNYKVVGTKENHTEGSEEFVTTVETEFELELTLELKDEDIVEIDGKDFIKIDPIYFDLDKSFIRPDSSIELEKVIAVMKRYPQMIVYIGSHTDSRNTHKYNEDLSSRRAASSLKYIVSRGIDRPRIYGSGYGETQLVNGCSDGVKCSEDEHQLNRRTEFVIIRYK
ncbi:MAG: outer membrane protein OmpA-like peptidoglycan-associated protein [bacterium]|jgi:outer membrane protein OmpA-like peptidoglycan-associated protein